MSKRRKCRKLSKVSSNTNKISNVNNQLEEEINNEQNDVSFEENDFKIRTCIDGESLNNSRSLINSLSTILSPKTPSPILNTESHHDEINTTPKKSSFFERSRNGSHRLNITNLDIIFSTPVREDLHQNELNLKLEEDPIQRNIDENNLSTHSLGVQTEIINNLGCNNLTQTENIRTDYETPKTERVVIIGRGLTGVKNNNTKCMSNVVTNGKFNLNPYLKCKELDIKCLKDVSVRSIDASFFTPELNGVKASSTPINVLNVQKIFNNIQVEDCERTILNTEENLQKLLESKPACMEFRFQKHKTPNLHSTSFPFIKKPVGKNTNKSPRKSVYYTKYPNRSFYPTRHTTYKTWYTRSETPEQYEGLNCDRFIDKIIKYSRLTAKWSQKLYEMCAQIGLTFKTSLTNLYRYYGSQKLKSDELETSNKCRCEEYRKQIEDLTSKIVDLNQALDEVKTMLTVSKNREADQIDKLGDELKAVTSQLGELKVLKSDIEILKRQQWICDKQSGLVETPLCIPPPPPPPPPPPALPIICQSLQHLKQTSMKKRLKRSDGLPKPMISLEDILKVKLKKPSDRPSAPSRRMSTPQPIVSLEMLQQVKLRSSSRPLTPVSLPDTSNEDSSLKMSPQSSLKRLLSENSEKPDDEV